MLRCTFHGSIVQYVVQYVNMWSESVLGCTVDCIQLFVKSGSVVYGEER